VLFIIKRVALEGFRLFPYFGHRTETFANASCGVEEGLERFGFLCHYVNLTRMDLFAGSSAVTLVSLSVSTTLPIDVTVFIVTKFNLKLQRY
jgi:hypothetical protein